MQTSECRVPQGGQKELALRRGGVSRAPGLREASTGEPAGTGSEAKAPAPFGILISAHC